GDTGVEPHVTADAELLAVAVERMRGFGLGPDDVRAKVSDRLLLQAILQALKVPVDQNSAVFGVIDKLDRQPREVSTGRLRELGLSSEASEVIIGLQRFKTPDQLREALGTNTALDARLEDR